MSCAEIEFNHKLIDLVSQHSIIYNHHLTDHHNKLKLVMAWKSIAASLNCPGNPAYFTTVFQHSCRA